MRELSVAEVSAVSGGIEVGGWDLGYGSVPGAVPEGSFGNGVTFGTSFSNGWSLDAGFNKTSGGFTLSYVW